MRFLKSALSQAFELVPDEAMVGLITFGTAVQVHELGFSGGSGIPKSYVFKGSKEVSKDKVMDQLNFSGKKRKPAFGTVAGVKDGAAADSAARFLLPASQCGFALNSLLEELQKDPWQVPTDKRASRCTGTALSIAAYVLGACVPASGARIMAFIGGPSTEGPGAIVSKNLSEPIRYHKDVDKGSAPHFRKAIKFYEGLSKQLVHQGHVLDLFACAVDQVGVAELRVAVERTGGFVVLGESFGHSEFKESLKRVFHSGEYGIGTASNAIFEVSCSKELKIQGVLGPCASLEKVGLYCSETVIGQGNTSAWKMCSLDKSTSLSIFFDIVKKDSPEAIGQATSSQFYLQFLTSYQHKGGRMRLRVTTLSRRSVTGPGVTQELIAGFDQEAAAVAMARLASFKMEIEAEVDPIRWLDMSLIRFCSKFGDYEKHSASSFSLSPRLLRFPEFMFYLRRSQFIQVFNYSPDETAFFRMMLNRENVANSILMVQPSLVSYSINSAPKPAPLDAASVAADRLLLLDAYFTIVVFHGATIAQWRKSGYQDIPDHKAFSQLLQAPRDAADALIKGRFPVPRLVICDQHGSQARFLVAKLNPSTTYNSDAPLIPCGDRIVTDDICFDIFLDHLQRLAVQQSQ